MEEHLLWTLSELLLMMFQRRVPLSQYADVFLGSVPPPPSSGWVPEGPILL